MYIHKIGIVIKPYYYYQWNAEIVGDTADTGGFYVFLYPPDKSQEPICYWNPDMEGVLESLK